MSTELSMKAVFKTIQVVKDFPKPGIVFRHIGPLLSNPDLFNYAIKQLWSVVNENNYDVICGLDARGFIIATALQGIAKLSQVLIRKKSKLPGEKYTVDYGKEYGVDGLELEYNAIKPGQRVLIVDDLMATAGTLIAAANLVKQAGGIVAGIAVLISFRDLKGLERISAIYPDIKNIYSLFSIDSINESNELDENVDLPLKFSINEYKQTVYNDTNDPNPVLMWHPTMESFAIGMLQCSNFRPSIINWSYFPDNWPNITFEPSKTLINNDLVILFNMSVKELFAEQLALLIALPRQLIKSLTIVIPYFGPGTHERVDYSGQLATAEPILKIISSCIPMTQTGPPVFRFFDIHSLHTRFYPSDNIIMKLISAVPVLLQKLHVKFGDEMYAVAFPDDGAHKRFKYFFEDKPQLICSKIRDKDQRKIIIRDRVNYPEDLNLIKHVIIIDDLAQSGQTLLSCAEALKKEYGFEKIYAYVTHAVFPNNAWKKFTITNQNDVIEEFFITNTNPTVSDYLKNIKPFCVLNVQEHLCREISHHLNSVKLINCDPKSIINSVYKSIINVYVASTNEAKLQAVCNAFNKLFKQNEHIFKIHSVSGCRSEIPEQPYTFMETVNGAKNRLNNLMTKVNDSNFKIFISIENGLCNILEDTFEKILKNTSTSYEDTMLKQQVIKPFSDFINGAKSLFKDNPVFDFPVVAIKFSNEPNTNIDTGIKVPSGVFIKQQYMENVVFIKPQYMKYVKESLESQDRSVTFGSIMEKKFGVKDWHKFMSGVSRSDIIEEVVYNILFKYYFQPLQRL